MEAKKERSATFIVSERCKKKKKKETKHVKYESIERKTEFFHLAVEKVKPIPTRAMINY